MALARTLRSIWRQEWTFDPICTAECGHDTTAPHREKEEITTDLPAGSAVALIVNLTRRESAAAVGGERGVESGESGGVAVGGVVSQ